MKRFKLTTSFLLVAVIPFVLIASEAWADSQTTGLSSELSTAVSRLNAGVKGDKGTVLVVVSSADTIPLANGKYHKTGYFLRELTDPLKEILLSGYDVEFATPGGKTPVVDANSLKQAWYWFPRASDAERRLGEATELMHAIDVLNGKTKPLSLEAARVRSHDYVGLLVPGGHAPMVDLRYDKDLGALLREFHEAQKPMGFVCHGPVALLSAQDHGRWVFDGYHVSVVSTADEKVLESNVIAPLIGHIDGRLVDYADQELEKAGAILAVSPVAGTPSFTRDRELITAQNPAGATALGKILVKAIAEHKGERVSNPAVEGIPFLSLADLAKMKRHELRDLYARGTVEKLPLGDSVGLGLVFSGYAGANYMSAYVWQGKVFSETKDGVRIANKIFGRAKNSNRTVDELRKIGPDLFLGRVSYRGADLGYFSLYFVE